MQTRKKLKHSVRCWVPKCRNMKCREDVKYFSFPSNPTRLCKWLKTVGCLELADLPYKFLIANRYVCQNHFGPEEIHMRMHRVSLVSGAFPRFFETAVPPLTDDDLEEFISRLPEKPAPDPPPAPVNAGRIEALLSLPTSTLHNSHSQEAASPSTSVDHTYATSGSSDDEYSLIVVPEDSPPEGAAASSAFGPAVAAPVRTGASTQEQECMALRRELRRVTRKAKVLQEEVDQLRALTKCQNLEVVLTVKCSDCLRSAHTPSVQL